MINALEFLLVAVLAQGAILIIAIFPEITAALRVVVFLLEFAIFCFLCTHQLV